MKILHADTDDLANPLAGGQPRRTFEINRHIAKTHHITVLTATFKGAKRKTVREGIHYLRLGVRIPPFGLSPHLTYLACLGPAVKLIPHDLLVEEFMAPVGFSIPPFCIKKPVITIVQWFFFETWQNRYGLPFFNWMKRLGERIGPRHFIVQTDNMAQKITSLFPQAICQKIPCGISEKAFIDDEGSSKHVLFLGRLDCRQKGLDMLMEIWSDICHNYAIPLIIAGDGEDRKHLERLVSQYDIQKHVKFTGKVAGKDKKKLIQECRFLVMPSRHETFGLSALEAMAAGKPVVAFDIENLNEVLRPAHAVLVQGFDLAAMGKAVIELWKRPELCRDLGEKGRRSAQDYLWSRLARIQDDFYRHVARENLG